MLADCVGVLLAVSLAEGVTVELTLFVFVRVADLDELGICEEVMEGDTVCV